MRSIHNAYVHGFAMSEILVNDNRRSVTSHWSITTGHVIRPTCHYDVIDCVFVAKRRSLYDVIDFVFVAKRRDHYDVIDCVFVVWQETHNQ